MDNNAMEFCRLWYAIFFSIFGDAIGANQNISRNQIGLNIIEGNDVGIGIMFQVLLIDGKQMVIGTEKIAYISHFFILELDNLLNPLTNFISITKVEMWRLNVKGDSHRVKDGEFGEK